MPIRLVEKLVFARRGLRGLLRSLACYGRSHVSCTSGPAIVFGQVCAVQSLKSFYICVLPRQITHLRTCSPVRIVPDPAPRQSAPRQGPCQTGVVGQSQVVLAAVEGAREVGQVGTSYTANLQKMMMMMTMMMMMMMMVV